MAKKNEVNFEEGLQRLQEIVESLEQGAATLSETLSLYEEGVKLAAELNATLDDAETRIEELSAGLGTNRDNSIGDDILVPDETPGEDNGELF